MVRIATRRATPGCAPAYEALLAGMFEDVTTHPGFVGAQIIPPTGPGGEYQVVLQFETEAGIEAWFGIFPTVTLVSGLLGPRLVMPRRVRLFRRWLAP